LAANAELKLVTFVPAENADRLHAALAEAGAGVIGEYTKCSSQIPAIGTFLGSDASNPVVGAAGRLETVSEVRLEMVCPKSALGRIARVMRDVHPYEEPAWDVIPLAPRPTAGVGIGRALELGEAATLETLVGRLKAHVGRSALRVAASPAHRSGASLRRVAVCAGSGKSVFDGAPGYELYVTGELSHHAVLAHVASGASVVLLEHSTSERGYLPAYAARLAEGAGGALETLVSGADREPLESW
ncbi:MAG TPA: Nif3-like dinuclear metal center hexameric protein, partial [Polyangiaceae bacterium]|nr:Nif3-like dinuclear metal center hexameric protein [Polyangiaceae bacterium]